MSLLFGCSNISYEITVSDLHIGWDILFLIKHMVSISSINLGASLFFPTACAKLPHSFAIEWYEVDPYLSPSNMVRDSLFPVRRLRIELSIWELYGYHVTACTKYSID